MSGNEIERVWFMQESVKRCERKVDNYVAYENSLCAARDFMHTLSDEIAANSDTTGDVLSVAARLQRITELAVTLPEGRATVEACVSAAAVVSKDFDSFGRQSVLAGVDDIQKQWHELEARLNDAKQSLSDVVKRWDVYNKQCQAVDEWLRNMEKSVRKEVMISDVGDVTPLVKSCQVKLRAAAYSVNGKFHPLRFFCG